MHHPPSTPQTSLTKFPTHTRTTQPQPPPPRTLSPPSPHQNAPPTTTTTKIERNIYNVVLGDILFPTWYPSFYPEELVGRDLERLYVCQWCFKYSRELIPFLAHVKLCLLRSANPPGRLIYSRNGQAIYEVDGEEYQLLTQNLSLFAKLFLDNKSVFYDVGSFKYYLLILHQHHHHNKSPSSSFPSPISPSSHPGQIVGFFSKEKMSWDENNLACILIFPPWQRRGLGKILMGVSYELSRRENRIGGPEKPLSELGMKGYTRFWEARVARFVLDDGGGGGGGGGGGCGKESGSGAERRGGVGGKLTIGEIAERCCMLSEDVIVALKEMGLLLRWEGDADDGADETIIKISKRMVREWVDANRVDLEPPVCEEGFVEDEDEDEEDEGDEDEGRGRSEE